MIYFSDAFGSITRCVPERIYQGSAEGNRLFLVAPFAQNTDVSVAFCLPDGTSTERYRMEYAGEMEGVRDAVGGAMYGWRLNLPVCVTNRYGSVLVQFYRTTMTDSLASFSSRFTVERGVAAALPSAPGADIYQSIVEALSAIGADLHNGYYAARAIYAWNASHSYGGQEITFYPVGEYGAFVRSKTANQGQEPYQNGVLNTAYWEEVANFNRISDDFFGELRALASAAAASASAAAQTVEQGRADVAELLEEGTQAVETIATRAEQAMRRAEELAALLGENLGKDVLVVAKLPAQPEAGKLYLLVKGEESLFELWTYSDGTWANLGGADILLRTTEFFYRTLSVADWSSQSQTVAVEEMRADDEILVLPTDGFSARYIDCGVRAAEIVDAGIRFVCTTVPSVDLSVCLAVTHRQEVPPIETIAGYTKDETDALLAAQTAKLEASDAALGVRVDEILSGAKSVAHAVSADTATEATHAVSADTAAEATHAVSADTATEATHAGSADTATEATHAATADAAKDSRVDEILSGAKSVAHAVSADTAAEATHAVSADTATEATHAVSADTAAEATHATSSDQTERDGQGQIIAQTYAPISALAGKADTSGNYPNLTAGRVANMLSIVVNGQTTEFDGSSPKTVAVVAPEGAADAVRFTAQALTAEQQAQARENIGAVSADELAGSGTQWEALVAADAALDARIDGILDGSTPVANAQEAESAAEATRATCDSEGRTIAETYALRPSVETLHIAADAWVGQTGTDPFRYCAAATVNCTIGDSVVELFCDQPILFAKYGFAIGQIEGQQLTLYAIDCPVEAVELSVGIYNS